MLKLKDSTDESIWLQRSCHCQLGAVIGRTSGMIPEVLVTGTYTIKILLIRHCFGSGEKLC